MHNIQNLYTENDKVYLKKKMYGIWDDKAKKKAKLDLEKILTLIVLPWGG